MRKSILMLKQMQTQRRADSRPPLPHQDEFPAEYSLVGCSPAEPASAFSAMLILNQKPTVGYCFSANGNCPRTRLSHLTTQANPWFDQRLSDGQWADPLLLLMAAVIA